LCQPSLEDVLQQELTASFRQRQVRVEAAGVLSVAASDRSPGALTGRLPRGARASDDDVIDPAFARQVLPLAHRLEAPTRDELAARVFAHLSDDDERAFLEGALVVEVICADLARQGSRVLDAHPLEGFASDLQTLLETKAEGRARKHEVARRDGPPERALTLLVTEAGGGFLAGASAPLGSALTSWPVPFPGGRAEVPPDFDAPSSAHRKLDEALAWLGKKPTFDDVVLDLGAAPGGWSYVAVREGAKVIAVDRGEMDPKLMASGKVIHVRKDAFAHAPLDEATFIVCDIIGEPHRTLDLLEQALGFGRVSAFVVTLKLKRPIDVSAIERGRALLAGLDGWQGRVKNLLNNKCEVTLMAHRRDEGTAP